MMHSDIIDEIDFLEGLQKCVPILSPQKYSSIVGALQQAALIADEEQWQQLTQWLITLTDNMNLLLPEIQSGLKSTWYQDRNLPSVLVNKLA